MNENEAAEWFRVGFAQLEFPGDGLNSFPSLSLDPKLGVLASLHSLYDSLGPIEKLNFREGIRLGLESGVGVDSPTARRALLKLAKRYKPSGLRELVERWWRTRTHDSLHSSDQRSAEVSAFVDYLCCYEADPRLLEFFIELRSSPDWRPSFASAMLVFALPAAGPRWVEHLRNLERDFTHLRQQFPNSFSLRDLLIDFCQIVPLKDLKDGLKAWAHPEDWMLPYLFEGDEAPLILTTRMIENVPGIDVLVAKCRSEQDFVEMGPIGWPMTVNESWPKIRFKFKRSEPSPSESYSSAGNNVVICVDWIAKLNARSRS
ncbi:hypothetical protein [Tahibacter sp.]|uniref:hypothetical protein n=1 Tax=Tahibacter sp. TaxID=2056211 RepID=UPI0028C4C02E|nr:hypothetical protein [Tahibacter sp.]